MGARLGGGPEVPVVSYRVAAQPPSLLRAWLQATANYLEKEWTARGPGERLRSKPILTTGCARWRSQTLRSPSAQSHSDGVMSYTLPTGAADFVEVPSLVQAAPSSNSRRLTTGLLCGMVRADPVV